MATTLHELLAENNIRMKRFSSIPEADSKGICPQCHGGRTKEESLVVRIHRNGTGLQWKCFRGTCGWTGIGYLETREAVPHQKHEAEAPKPIQKPAPHTPQQRSSRPPWLWEFFDERNIGAKTVEHFGVYAMNRRFPDPVGESDALVFPFVHKGDVVNRKYRPYPAKNPMLQDKDALQTLFNIDALGDAPAEVIFVEGEPDVMAMFECGFPHAVTLKDGAPAKVGDGNEKRFAALATHADVLKDVTKVILAGDMDGPGMALREELAQRLGRHRCWLVDWPEGCKDACDVLKFLGAEALQAAMATARPYPISGLRRIEPGSLLKLRDAPAVPVMTVGVPAVDDVIKFPTEGRLIVVTGFPSMGKTSFVKFLMVRTAHRAQRKWLVFSPEMQPWLSFIAECAEVLAGAPFWTEGLHQRMTDDEALRAERWLGERIFMLEVDSEDEAPTADWLIERARYAVLTFGITDLLIDPWNEMEQSRGALSETDFIGRTLQRLKAFGLRHSDNVWIVAHPAKPPQLRNGEKRAVPGPYEIAGSAHWANRSDVGITVHQPDGVQFAADVHVWKSRFRRWGVKGGTAKTIFDPLCGRYSSAAAEPEADLFEGPS